MQNFIEFYLNGGVFDHAITIVLVVGMTALALHRRARKLGVDGERYLWIVDRMAILCLGLGVIGTVFGVMEMSAALRFMAEGGADPATVDMARDRAMAIVPIPLGWAGMCAVPLWIGATVFGRRRPAVPAAQ